MPLGKVNAPFCFAGPAASWFPACAQGFKDSFNITMAHILLAVGWLAYGFVHSLMASLSAKNFVKKTVPQAASYYRIFYNIFATLTFILLIYYQFQIEKTRLWNPSLSMTVIGGGLAGIGLGVVLAAVAQYDMAEFTGLDRLRQESPPESTLKTTGLSGLVRHPLYTGTLLVLWGFWLMDSSLASLIMATCLSAYIRIGIHFEEKKLLREFGEEYAHYQQRVPMLFPAFL
jgi:methanethiol S-methyltransferase